VTADASHDDIRDAISAARRAFDETAWATDHEFRANAIRQLADAMVEDKEVLREVLVAEAGVPGCEAALWTAIVVPAGVPADIIKKLHAAVLAAVATPEIQQALTIQGVDPEPGPPEAVSERIKADIVKWKDVVTAAKITGTQ